MDDHLVSFQDILGRYPSQCGLTTQTRQKTSENWIIILHQHKPTCTKHCRRDNKNINIIGQIHQCTHRIRGILSLPVMSPLPFLSCAFSSRLFILSTDYFHVPQSVSHVSSCSCSVLALLISLANSSSHSMCLTCLTNTCLFQARITSGSSVQLLSLKFHFAAKNPRSFKTCTILRHSSFLIFRTVRCGSSTLSFFIGSSAFSIGATRKINS